MVEEVDQEALVEAQEALSHVVQAHIEDHHLLILNQEQQDNQLQLLNLLKAINSLLVAKGQV